MLIDFFNIANENNVILGDECCRFVFQKIIIALNKLHCSGIAHRDIKPENIMITHDFKIKLIDLGYGT